MKRRLREAHGKLANAIFGARKSYHLILLNNLFIEQFLQYLSLSMQNPRQNLSQLISSALVHRGRAERNGIWEATLTLRLFPPPYSETCTLDPFSHPRFLALPENIIKLLPSRSLLRHHIGRAGEPATHSRSLSSIDGGCQQHLIFLPHSLPLNLFPEIGGGHGRRARGVFLLGMVLALWLHALTSLVWA